MIFIKNIPKDSKRKSNYEVLELHAFMLLHGKLKGLSLQGFCKRSKR
jgi:hypothetical protein